MYVRRVFLAWQRDFKLINGSIASANVQLQRYISHESQTAVSEAHTKLE